MEEPSKNKKIAQLGIGAVISRTYHFMDWVDGKHVDEMIKAVNRETAIEQMKVKYPNHDFAYVCELS